MKNLYKTPDLELIELMNQDILTTSKKDPVETDTVETDENGDPWTSWG